MDQNWWGYQRYEDVPSKTAVLLRLQSKLLKSQRAQLKRLYWNSRAFFTWWTNRIIFWYQSMKSSWRRILSHINATISHFPRENRIDIDKQLTSGFFSRGHQDSNSPWELLLSCLQNERQGCALIMKSHMVTMADKYPLPRQSEFLELCQALSGFPLFDALSGFYH